MYDIRVRSEEGHEVRSKLGVFVCQPKGESGEYELEVATVLEIARAKERCPKASFCEEPLRDGLSDRRFSCASKTIQPEDWRLVEVPGPRLDLVEHRVSRPFETSTAVAMAVLG